MVKIILLATLFIFIGACGVKKDPTPLYRTIDPPISSSSPTPTPYNK